MQYKILLLKKKDYLFCLEILSAVKLAEALSVVSVELQFCAEF